jgi:hypothetical protein
LHAISRFYDTHHRSHVEIFQTLKRGILVRTTHHYENIFTILSAQRAWRPPQRGVQIRATANVDFANSSSGLSLRLVRPCSCEYQNDSGPVGSAYAPPPLSSVGPPSEATGSALVIGREGVVAALDSDTTTSADALRDAEVYAPSGKEVGDIDEVMIDTDRGKVAYILLPRGGFLGMDKTWFALPVEALVQTSYRTGYRLTLDKANLNGLPTLHADRQNLPARVSTAQLAALYDHFNIRPYWDQSTQPEAAQTNGSAPLAKKNSEQGSTR